MKILHYLLKDKQNYHKDAILKARWESYKFILNYVKRESFSILKYKLIYFLTYKKLSTLKRLLFGLSVIILLYFSVYFVSKYIINYFGWNIEKIIKPVTKITEYVPDTILIEKRIQSLSKTLDISKHEINKKFDFIVFYTVDSTKTFKRYLELLGEIESGNEYTKRRTGSQYLGRWQMGDDARRTVGFNNISYEKFLNTPEIQDAAVVLYMKHNYNYMKPYLIKYDNKIIRGYHLTISGLIAMSHNCGADAVIQWLKRNCAEPVPRDGNGSSDRFLTLGNYNLTTLEK
jgi:hypothetical protein